MPEPFDLNDVIQGAVDDARVDDSLSSVDDTADVDTLSSDAPVEGSEAPVDGAEAPVEEVDATSEISSPAARGEQEDPNAPQFALDKKLGIPSHTNGRENRIPYSRVKKIVEGAERKAIEPLQKQIAELAPKVTAYEERLTQVAEFENIMLNDSQRFLQMLSTVPAYQGFFNAINEMQQRAVGQAQAQPQTVADDAMPGPDDEETGTYTMAGLNKLLEWQGRQVENRVTKQVEDKYAPLKEQYDAQQRINQLVPQVENQIREARTWPQFNENEAAIVEHLNRYPNSKLEEAYRVVVMPKLQADRNSMRTQLLQELRTAPKATSAPVVSRRPDAQVASSGPRSLEDVIAEQARSAGLIR